MPPLQNSRNHGRQNGIRGIHPGRAIQMGIRVLPVSQATGSLFAHSEKAPGHQCCQIMSLLVSWIWGSRASASHLSIAPKGPGKAEKYCRHDATARYSDDESVDFL